MKINNINIINKLQNINTTSKKNEIEAEDFEKILKTAQQSGDESKLKQATQQFEQIFLNMLMKNMRSTISDGGLTEKSYAREMFEGMLDEEMTKEVSKGQGIGISKLMYDQLSKALKDDMEE